MNCKPEIRPATAQDIQDFYGRSTDRTLRAVAIEWNGELAGLAGIAMEADAWVVFSDMKDGLKPPKTTVWRVAREITKWVRNMRVPVFAIATPGKPETQKFIAALGFQRLLEQDDNVIFKL